MVAQCLLLCVCPYHCCSHSPSTLPDAVILIRLALGAQHNLGLMAFGPRGRRVTTERPGLGLPVWRVPPLSRPRSHPSLLVGVTPLFSHCCPSANPVIHTLSGNPGRSGKNSWAHM